MPKIDFDHPVTFRQESLTLLFSRVAAGESCALVGRASMGKSRLMRFLLRSDVQYHYLGDDAGSILLVLVDGNRLAEASPWGLYELLLTSLADASARLALDDAQRAELGVLRREVITTPDPHLAWRDLERAVSMLHEDAGTRLCFVLDEFDTLYRDLPSLALENLRALRDAHKYDLSYVVALRDDPARLRPSAECEAFCELFSRSVIGLCAYSAVDAARMVDQLEARKGHRLDQGVRAQILGLAGGHPGLIVTLFDAAADSDLAAGRDWIEWALDQPSVEEECQTLWRSLGPDEQRALNALMHGAEPDRELGRLLAFTGLLRVPPDTIDSTCADASDGAVLFSPLFARFVEGRGVPGNVAFSVDEASRQVRVANRTIEDLTASQFDLLAFLYRHRGRVCTRDDILDHLRPDEEHGGGVSDHALTSLVRHTRAKIEPVPKRPQYLITVRGVGYKLVACQQDDE